jgi:glyoxylate/hydroxypyruvate/2-ketogluconate reductase
MKPKILVTREVFDETLAYLAEHCEVEANQGDKPFDPVMLAERLKDKDGVVCCLTDRIDGTLLAAAPRLKVVANIAALWQLIRRACSMTARRISPGH